MSETRLVLVRHGETTWNAEKRMQGQLDSSLNERGLSQAQARSADMLAQSFDAKYCSSSLRTRQTIDALLDGAVQGVCYQDNLREINLGPWQGQLSYDLAKNHPEQFRLYTEQPEQFELAGAETFAEIQNRAVTALEKIVADHTGQKVLVVSHGLFIKVSLLHWLGLPLSQVWQEPRITNCSSSVLAFDASGAGRVLQIAESGF